MLSSRTCRTANTRIQPEFTREISFFLFLDLSLPCSRLSTCLAYRSTFHRRSEIVIVTRENVRRKIRYIYNTSPRAFRSYLEIILSRI